MNRIKELRLKKGLLQADLASMLSTKPQTISRYEKEERGLDVETICKLCDIFGCTADYLLGRSTNPAPAVSDEDATILSAYHASDLHIQAAIKTLLAPHLQKNQQAEVS